MENILHFDKIPEYLGKPENTSYRTSIREFFMMKMPDDIPSDIDDESLDEILYDSCATKRGLEYIYDQTKDDLLFSVLYKLSAGLMLSEDEEIGLAVLFSYDYFQSFFYCLRDFFTNPDGWTEQCESYMTLYNKFQRN